MSLSWELWGIITTLTLFVISHTVTAISSLREDRRKKRNLRTMLIQEMVLNYQWLSNVIPEHRPDDQMLEEIEVVAAVAAKLELSVYNAYLNQLNELPAQEVRVIYDAYQTCKHIGNIAQDLLEAAAADPSHRSTRYRLASGMMEVTAKATVVSLQKALIALLGERFKEKLHYGKVNGVAIAKNVAEEIISDLKETS